MKQEPADKPHVHKEQLAYAGVLDKLSHFAILFLTGSYAAYIFQLLPRKVSIADIAANWHLRASLMQEKLDAPLGWSFMSGMESFWRGDALSYFAIILICMIPVVCLLVTAPAFFREKRPVFGVIAILQVLILLVAATGVLVR
ncbi:hypothetical protein EKD00_03115 [Chlorobium phaeovibrioides]|uniref:DUF1634 domain-containing protein n=1 Tax=Chlorobium phaeovibrioides TaxID=1094 RepID=A0A432AVG3_CHLPH|nr:hypothetical protein [Chlorobium phaeovibrioides]KAA6231698.1 hypothetical protein FP507_00170 [Chlorobium phaeovibrioides]RTY36737.1 hypothetical protein EKD00_03115 [Chlorobium phaeovibrioides]RTY38152.1 hypothetical protein EKD02_05500 [Chlorobium phaeovibrioides]